MGKETPRGILVGDAALYDSLGHRLLGPFFRGVAADVAATAPEGARILEVGCGPGRLAIRLAAPHGLDVTGLDLDPAMIQRARDNAARASGEDRRPSFIVGDVAALAFPNRSFDVVVSTLSMHHWTDPAAGLNEIARVLRQDGRALVWDFRRGFIPLHGRLPEPAEHAHGTLLHVVSTTPWRWPWRLALTQRVSRVAAVDPAGQSMADPFDEDADIRSHLAALGPAALAELRRILEAPDRTAVLRALTARPTAADLATLIEMADTDEVVRLRLLRAIRDLGV
jgi:SAM-dependent methyltransferase